MNHRSMENDKLAEKALPLFALAAAAARRERIPTPATTNQNLPPTAAAKRNTAKPSSSKAAKQQRQIVWVQDKARDHQAYLIQDPVEGNPDICLIQYVDGFQSIEEVARARIQFQSPVRQARQARKVSSNVYQEPDSSPELFDRDTTTTAAAAKMKKQSKSVSSGKQKSQVEPVEQTMGRRKKNDPQSKPPASSSEEDEDEIDWDEDLPERRGIREKVLSSDDDSDDSSGMEGSSSSSSGDELEWEEQEGDFQTGITMADDEGETKVPPEQTSQTKASTRMEKTETNTNTLSSKKDDKSKKESSGSGSATSSVARVPASAPTNSSPEDTIVKKVKGRNRHSVPRYVPTTPLRDNIGYKAKAKAKAKSKAKKTSAKSSGSSSAPAAKKKVVDPNKKQKKRKSLAALDSSASDPNALGTSQKSNVEPATKRKKRGSKKADTTEASAESPSSSKKKTLISKTKVVRAAESSPEYKKPTLSTVPTVAQSSSVANPTEKVACVDNEKNPLFYTTSDEEEDLRTGGGDVGAATRIVRPAVSSNNDITTPSKKTKKKLSSPSPADQKQHQPCSPPLFMGLNGYLPTPMRRAAKGTKRYREVDTDDEADDGGDDLVVVASPPSKKRKTTSDVTTKKKIPPAKRKGKKHGNISNDTDMNMFELPVSSDDEAWKQDDFDEKSITPGRKKRFVDNGLVGSKLSSSKQKHAPAKGEANSSSSTQSQTRTSRKSASGGGKAVSATASLEVASAHKNGEHGVIPKQQNKKEAAVDPAAISQRSSFSASPSFALPKTKTSSPYLGHRYGDDLELTSDEEEEEETASSIITVSSRKEGLEFHPKSLASNPQNEMDHPRKQVNKEIEAEDDTAVANGDEDSIVETPKEPTSTADLHKNPEVEAVGAISDLGPRAVLPRRKPAQYDLSSMSIKSIGQFIRTSDTKNCMQLRARDLLLSLIDRHVRAAVNQGNLLSRREKTMASPVSTEDI